jgi:hypothetical protein
VEVGTRPSPLTAGLAALAWRLRLNETKEACRGMGNPQANHPGPAMPKSLATKQPTTLASSANCKVHAQPGRGRVVQHITLARRCWKVSTCRHALHGQLSSRSHHRALGGPSNHRNRRHPWWVPGLAPLPEPAPVLANSGAVVKNGRRPLRRGPSTTTPLAAREYYSHVL